MNSAFWAGKRVFVTGHTGFKGSWLSYWLVQLGAQVTGYALPPETTPNLFDALNLSSRMASVHGDVRDQATLERCLDEAKPEVVFHMAAQAQVRRSYEDPVGTYASNVMGTVNLLDAIRRVSSVRAVVNVTSDKCYENREWLWGYRENDPMGGHDPYSSSKGCAELVTAAFRSSYFPLEDYARHGLALASTRAGNVIGGGDWSTDRLVPDVMKALMTDQMVIIRNPSAVRPWQHVLEPLHGYMILAERLHGGDLDAARGWNFGPAAEDARPVSWIADHLIAAWGGNARWEIHDSCNKPLHEAGYLKLDCSLANVYLDWRPRWGLSEALTQITGWYKIWAAGGDIQNETLRQIDQFSRSGRTG